MAHRREILIEAGLVETRIALTRDGQIEELYIERDETPSLVGSIWVGRVSAIATGVQAAFVDLGLARHGFLNQREARALKPAAGDAPIETLLSEGQSVLVQVKKEPQGEKGAGLTGFISLPGRHLVLTPMTPSLNISRRIGEAEERARLVTALSEIGVEGAILRTAAAGRPVADIAAEARRLRLRFEDIARAARSRMPPACLWREPVGVERVLRDRLTEDVDAVLIEGFAGFERARRHVAAELGAELVARLALHRGPAPLFERDGVAEQIEALMRSRVRLPSGGALAIETTRALTAIDVDSGRDAHGADQERTALRTNLEAATEAARQIRLRDIGGIVVIDFIQMAEAASRARVMETLAGALAADRAPVRHTPISEFGLVEITRRRQGETLLGRTTDRCACCNGAGRVTGVAQEAADVLRAIAREAEHAPGRAVTVRLRQAVIDHLAQHVARDALRDGSGRPPTLLAAELPAGGFHLSFE